VSAWLERIERVIDASRLAHRIEALLPAGVRARQLQARTLLVGIVLAMLAGREAFLRNVHKLLLALPADQQLRLGVIAQWKHGQHALTYRQLEYTFALVAGKLSKPEPDGSPSELLFEVLDALLEATVTVLGEPPSSSYAADWTDHQTWSRPPSQRAQRAAPEHDKPTPTHAEPAAGNTEPAADHAEPSADDAEPAPGDAEQQLPDERQRADRQPPPAAGGRAAPAPDTRRADLEAASGHRRGDNPGQADESFYGYYLQAVTIVKDEHGPEVPELVRRIHLASCDHDPPGALVPVLQRMAASGITIGDLLADSGYSYRVAKDWALPIRQLGARPVHDLHPNDRGTHGTHQGAICANGNLYCPATPNALLELGPLHRAASAEQTKAHDKLSDELARYKLSPLTSYDPDGYRRVACPAAQRKLRCPLRPSSMTLPHDHPQILTPPEQPPTCCQQQTITVPPTINAKTTQKHDYPSPAHRASDNRRSAAERTFATLTDRATNDLTRGWCRLMGLTPIALFIAGAIIARNLRIADAFTARQADNEQRAANGLPPKQRKRRRHTTNDLINAATARPSSRPRQPTPPNQHPPRGGDPHRAKPQPYQAPQPSPSTAETHPSGSLPPKLHRRTRPGADFHPTQT